MGRTSFNPLHYKGIKCEIKRGWGLKDIKNTAKNPFCFNISKSQYPNNYHGDGGFFLKTLFLCFSDWMRCLVLIYVHDLVAPTSSSGVLRWQASATMYSISLLQGMKPSGLYLLGRHQSNELWPLAPSSSLGYPPVSELMSGVFLL